MITGSLSTVKIVDAQSGLHRHLPHWYVFTPWGFAGFVLFMIAATAETNRSPFDLPEGESEMVAGYFTEYSGFKFALFFLGEYLGMFAISGLGSRSFSADGPRRFRSSPGSRRGSGSSPSCCAICFFIWLRGTLPRLRMDQLMNFAWKFMLPMALLNLLVAGALALHGRWLAALGGLQRGAARWPMCCWAAC
jgi:NADH-quinone oxidoreductase subunit H